MKTTKELVQELSSEAIGKGLPFSFMPKWKRVFVDFNDGRKVYHEIKLDEADTEKALQAAIEKVKEL